VNNKNQTESRSYQHVCGPLSNDRCAMFALAPEYEASCMFKKTNNVSTKAGSSSVRFAATPWMT
jgi:hypothetical protein